MRFIKLVFISILVLFGIITAIGLIFPSVVRVTRITNVNASNDSVYHLVSDVKYWKLWMEGAKENTIQFLSNKTAGTGTIAKVGNNKIYISKSDKINIEIKWEDSKGNQQLCFFILNYDSSKNITNIQWSFEQHLNWYPWERFGAMMNDKILGPNMEKSLDNLKKVAEK